ncbi:glucokinase, partial [Acinetobacter baumannii]|nr:glucokinase [Acinetobacter baumannii]
MTAFQSRPSTDRLYSGGARLLADIGGTNCRFVLEVGPGRLEGVEVLPCADYATLGEAMRTYL